MVLGAIADIESQIETLKGNLETLRANQKKKEKEKKKKKEVKKRPSPVASSSKPNGKESKRSGGGGGGGGASASTSKKQSKKSGGVYNSDVLSFEQKKELSETIQTLDGDKLEKVIQIIHDGVPEVRDVSINESIYVLSQLMHLITEHGRNRTGYRPTAGPGIAKVIQLCYPSSASDWAKAQTHWYRHRHGWAEEEEHG